MKRLLFHLLHRRMGLFWLVAITGLAAPWLLPRLEWSGADPQLCQVSKIHDGDTLNLSCNGQRLKVRLHCIDAPELSQKPWGQRSRDHLRQITPAQVQLIARERDKYGRTVGEIRHPGRGQSLNLVQVQQGQAAVYRRYCNDPRYLQAQHQAQQQGQGIWSQAGDWQTPWLYRQQ
jgi:endonuclease YncB( thermonuclease family)